MATRTIERDQWKRYLDDVSKHLKARLIEIEVAGLDVGDQIAVEWVPLKGLTYDPKNDLVEIQTESHGHLIHKPKSIFAEEGVGGLETLCVVDAEDRKQIVRLKAPLALPGGS